MEPDAAIPFFVPGTGLYAKVSLMPFVLLHLWWRFVAPRKMGIVFGAVPAMWASGTGSLPEHIAVTAISTLGCKVFGRGSYACLSPRGFFCFFPVLKYIFCLSSRFSP